MVSLDEGPIVVGYDGSACARAALHWAGAFALQRAVPLAVLIAWQPAVPGRTMPQLAASSRPAIERVTRSVADAMRGEVARGLVLSTDLVEGAPGEVLLGATARAGLLVLGLRGDLSTSPVVGSVTRLCLRSSRCPVALVDQHVPGRTPARRVVLDEECRADDELLRWASLTAVGTVLPLHVLAVSSDALDVLALARALVGDAGVVSQEYVDGGVPAAVREYVRTDDLLVVGRAAGPVPSLVLRAARGPVIVLPTGRAARARRSLAVALG